MTKFTRYYRCLTTLLLMLLAATAKGQSTGKPGLEYYDSVEISLITCSPHEEIYSLYGHTALRYNDWHTKRDLVMNWGVFNIDEPYFIPRFVLGMTDYMLGAIPMKYFCAYYRKWGSEVSEQVLNLTTVEKARIAYAIAENLLPQNVTYRYNIFYDNCSTRPRDIVERNLEGRVIWAERPGFEPSFREMTREMTAHHDWATMGNDLLLGVKADLRTTRQEQEFLPCNLQYDFDHAQVYANGEYRPLVRERRTLVPAGVQMVKKDFPLSPTDCGIILLLIGLGLFLVEWKRRRCFVWFDALLMLPMGIAGCLLLVMLFSQHPTTSTNLQILLLHPLHLIFLPAVVRRRKTRYWNVMVTLTLLFCLGGIWQHYAEGTAFLALSLLLRYWSHLHND